MTLSMKHALAALLLVPGLLSAEAARAQESADPAAIDTLRAVEVSAVEVQPRFVNAAAVARAVEAQYPAALRDGGVGGKPVVRVLVDVRGLPRLPRVDESSGNAELDSAAVRVVAGARFRPGRWAGRPYPVWLEVPVTFVSPKAPSDTVKAVRPSFDDLAGTEELPELSNRNYVTSVINRNYPPQMRMAGVSGNVTARFRLNTDGRPGMVRIERASRPEFVVAAVLVVEAMRFRPARVNGKPVSVWVTVPIFFQVSRPPLPPAASARPRDGAGAGGTQP
jgi:TonB family protein